MIKLNTIQIAGILGGLAVAIGAFGAHGLEAILESNARTETFETAVKYHFYHALAILAVGIWQRSEPVVKRLNTVVWMFFIGILIFSGSLYVLSLTGISWLGAITPIGGVAFILGWGLLAFSVKKSQNKIK
ncbi:Uncharacterized membrane protein YgdD, TMEM256/DUF423 family [Aquiflexum balticum DSM 16537]|uniref:Uncharacterized membrane protein YgdD, TMEM256/DUF423 family n=1 Tax=Aquiflexum balticum DSM 16537 TaxID=758820 RepID=A0A1W2H5G0_9BACT|nr:DUF423 domain-containing protein [Aquiflexum balticum]SMD44141.1 Uncharacterized membrane protein YgdD, TMEM256/DUF423 family [Aquiflexum balticum DSM 16537]